MATSNPCRLCAPLGAALAFCGIRGAIALLHGSQGCATYIRRYLISHFREPVDIASSSFDEATTVFGGGDNLASALRNLTAQYGPEMIGVASTCLSETIGEDIRTHLARYKREGLQLCKGSGESPEVVFASTPSYSMTHVEGFSIATAAVIRAFAQAGSTRERQVNLMPGLLSPADLRYLKDLVEAVQLRPVLAPDYSETLDGVSWTEYRRLPPGGTPISEIREMGRSVASIELGEPPGSSTAGSYLQEVLGVELHSLRIPVGVEATDRLVSVLEALSGNRLPASHLADRGRLVDSYADGHKYVFGKRVVIVSDSGLAAALAQFCGEVGMVPVLCATGEANSRLEPQIRSIIGSIRGAGDVIVLEDTDFVRVSEAAAALEPDLVIGTSKGYKLSRELSIPLIRVGFPVHDRFGAQRIQVAGYRGTQQLFDRIVNAIIEAQQERSGIGYTYM